MRRLLLLLPLGAAIGLLATSPLAKSQPPDGEFGVLKTAPATPLPAGVEPAGDSSTTPGSIRTGRDAEGKSALLGNLSNTPEPTRSSPPANPFPLTAEVGPWLVCAAHYVGFDGFTLAHQVALELRNKHNLGAYIYNRGDEERRKQEEEWQQLKAKYPPGTPVRRRIVRVQDQYAVLVGGFPEVAAASAFLPSIKKLPLPTLTLSGGRIPYEIMSYQEVDPQTKKPVLKAAPINPFHNAMVVRNPLTVGGENKQNWDPLWVKLNSDEDRSLLKNPKPFTLLVKVYQGANVLQTGADGNGKSTGFLGSLGFGGSGGSSLDVAAAQARELAKFLSNKQFGFQTWILHTRHSSMVTVGGFSSPEDPDLKRIQRQLMSLTFSTEQKQSDPIGLLRNPLPIAVPHP